jgi:hypothetical protein
MQREGLDRSLCAIDSDYQPVFVLSKLTSTPTITDVSEPLDREPYTDECYHSPGIDHVSSVRRVRYDREIRKSYSK